MTVTRIIRRPKLGAFARESKPPRFIATWSVDMCDTEDEALNCRDIPKHGWPYPGMLNYRVVSVEAKHIDCLKWEVEVTVEKQTE